MSEEDNRSYDVIAIGASAGALEALSAVLKEIQKDFSIPILVVVHLPPDKKSILASVMDGRCNLRVLEAEDKMPINPGCVYVAPPDYHMMVERDGHLSLSSEEPENFSRPSIDVLFETVADIYGEKATAVLLTGANADGARGLKKIYDAGGLTIVQDPDTAYARMMPESGLKACPNSFRASPFDIGKKLASLHRSVIDRN